MIKDQQAAIQLYQLFSCSEEFAAFVISQGLTINPDEKSKQHVGAIFLRQWADMIEGISPIEYSREPVERLLAEILTQQMYSDRVGTMSLIFKNEITRTLDNCIKRIRGQIGNQREGEKQLSDLFKLGTPDLELAPDDIETLGKIVRAVWVDDRMTRRAAGFEVPEHHTAGWDALKDDEKAVDRKIGETIYWIARRGYAGKEIQYDIATKASFRAARDALCNCGYLVPNWSAFMPECHKEECRYRLEMERGFNPQMMDINRHEMAEMALEKIKCVVPKNVIYGWTRNEAKSVLEWAHTLSDNWGDEKLETLETPHLVFEYWSYERTLKGIG